MQKPSFIFALAKEPEAPPLPQNIKVQKNCSSNQRSVPKIPEKQAQAKVPQNLIPQ